MNIQVIIAVLYSVIYFMAKMFRDKEMGLFSSPSILGGYFHIYIKVFHGFQLLNFDIHDRVLLLNTLLGVINREMKPGFIPLRKDETNEG